MRLSTFFYDPIKYKTAKEHEETIGYSGDHHGAIANDRTCYDQGQCSVLDTHFITDRYRLFLQKVEKVLPSHTPAPVQAH